MLSEEQFNRFCAIADRINALWVLSVERPLTAEELSEYDALRVERDQLAPNLFNVYRS